MRKEDILNWLVGWFESNSMIEASEIRQKISVSYFEEGFIDSFVFIRLISDVEEKYHIEFDNEQFEDRNFATIEGLAEIIERSTSTSNSK